jgi:hypothetical protein
MVEIKDNFLSRHELEFIQNSFSKITWKVSRCVSLKDLMCQPIENFQLIHEFYSNYKPLTEHFELLMPLLFKIKPNALIRIKANLNPKSHKIVEHGFHIDHECKNAKTSIYYLNSNDGYTLFEDGTKVESVENRFITFNSGLKHSSTTCTNAEARIVINFNYF